MALPITALILSKGIEYRNYLDGSSQVNLIQGYAVDMFNSADNYCNIVQGWESTIDCSISMVQGYLTKVGVSGQNYGVLAQGNRIDVRGDYSFAQGDSCDILAGATHSFAQGADNVAAGLRSFVQGRTAYARQDDQKTWGSNRFDFTPKGAAQSSRLIKWLSTTATGPSSLAEITTITDTTYSMTCVVAARNTTTAAESASFVLSQALAYNDAGTAVLVGSPAFTKVDSGGGATSWTCTIDVSSALIRIRVGGEASDTVEWCCDLQFVEVAG